MFKHILSFIKGTSNIAYRKTADQSTTQAQHSSYKAVDGDRSGNLNDMSCTHTLRTESVHWWRVAFGGEAKVKSVQITNRNGGTSYRLGNFSILVGSSEANNGTGNNVCRSNLNMTGIAEKKFECQNDVVGKFLYVHSKLTDPLTLCEVEAYGVMLPVDTC